MRFSNLYLLLFFGSCLLFVTCEKDPQTDGSGFDQESMLKNIGENLIIPRYSKVTTDVIDLHSKAKDFTSNPTSQTLSDLQSSFKKTYRSWQSVSTFEFGPAKDKALRKNVNTFPTDTTDIDSSIITGNYDLTSFTAVDIKGFPAIDYLIFDPHEPSDSILHRFTNAPHAGNRKTYLTDVTQRIKKEVSTVYEKWKKSGGNYLKTFKNNTGTDAGSSVSLLINELNFDWEIIKNDKIGIPLGKKSLGNPFPKKVEGYFSETSLPLIMDHIKAIESIFKGDTDNHDGLGLEEYLDHVGATRNGDTLSTVINQQFETCKEKVNAVPAPLWKSITDNTSKVDQAFEVVQQQVVYLKTDMPSALGVRITYQDNDGD